MGARAYRLVERVIPEPNELIIEIGSDRGEGSTPFLRHWADEHGVNFVSVDIDPERGPDVVEDGEKWLKTVTQPIVFAYLDNYDFIYDEIQHESWVQAQRNHYEGLGYQLNNLNSMEAHFQQAKLVHLHSRLGSLVVFDDTWAEAHGYFGKGAWAVSGRTLPLPCRRRR